MKALKNILISVSALVVIGAVFLGGIYLGYSHRPYIERVAGIEHMTNSEATADFEPFWKVWNIIDKKYPNAKEVSADTRIYGAIKGLVDSLGDPYSVYFPPEDAKEFEDTINGSFDGIGMEVGMKDKVLTVIAPIKNTPAERAGIKAGDAILKIDDTITNDMTVDKAVHLIRGKRGTSVRLTLLTAGDTKPREVSVVRDTIEIPTLETTLRADNIFVVTLYNFGAASAGDMADAMEKFRKSGSSKLIIDLRGNPGGYLEAAVDIASFYLPEGDVIVSENTGVLGDKPTIYRSKGYGLVDPKKNTIVVLVDKGSASASEIVAGALKEHHAAILIGETTYGKGSVQEVLDVTNTTTLKLTVARWFTPNGISISKKGLEPDIAVKVPDNAKTDVVLERAVKYLGAGK